jgi:hypothetical protein
MIYRPAPRRCTEWCGAGNDAERHGHRPQCTRPISRASSTIRRYVPPSRGSCRWLDPRLICARSRPGTVAWPPEPIRTERLVLREPETRDRAAFIELLASPEVRTYLGGPGRVDQVWGSLPAALPWVSRVITIRPSLPLVSQAISMQGQPAFPRAPAVIAGNSDRRRPDLAHRLGAGRAARFGRSREMDRARLVDTPAA